MGTNMDVSTAESSANRRRNAMKTLQFGKL